MKLVTTSNEKDKGVSAIVGTILIVAITVVLAATVYGVLTGFGGLIGGTAPTGAITVSQSGGAYTVSVQSISNNVALSNIELKITNATGTYTSTPFSSGSATLSGYTISITPTDTLSISSVITITTGSTGTAISGLSIIDTSPSGTIASWSS